jgi:hypothetical protein
MTDDADSLHWLGDTVVISGYSFSVSRELQEALSEMLDAANNGDADRIRAAIDKYENLSRNGS